MKIDEIGNIFFIHAGTEKEKGPIGTGSCMDTQPAGGRYQDTFIKKPTVKGKENREV